MKQILLLALFAVTIVSTGCRRDYRGEVVKETYMHRYGVPIPKSDWDRNGQDGKIVQVRTDGITVSRSYEGGVLNGETTLTFPHSSTVQKIDTFKEGELVCHVENYPSGVPLREEVFREGDLEKVTVWYEDGTPAALESYRAGKLFSGEYRNPLNVVGARVQEGRGYRIRWGNDCEILSKDTVQNGSMIERITYFANSDPSAVTPYENGLIHGQRLTFLPGGLPNTVEEWRHGKQDGFTVTYLNGEKVSEIMYVAGEKHGTEYRYCDGTVLVEEVSWQHGVQHGPRLIIADGAQKTEWYHQGELVSRPTYERMNIR